MTSVGTVTAGHLGRSTVSSGLAVSRANFGLIVKTASLDFGAAVYLVWTGVSVARQRRPPSLRRHQRVTLQPIAGSDCCCDKAIDPGRDCTASGR